MSFWFWLLITGIFLILAAALLAGGLKEINGWVWGFFIAGIIIAILGIILAIVEWNRPCKINNVDSSSVLNDISHTPDDDFVDFPQVTTPMESSITTPMGSSITTPMGSPTRSKINVPQAQRGFTSTDISLSSLAQSL